MMRGLDPITRDALLHFSRLHPGAAIHMIEFLGGTQARCGFVPHDWDGTVVDVGNPWK